MSDQQQLVIEKLDRLGISYELVHHPAVFTIAQMESEEIFRHGDVCKNLFLRDDKGRNHFLVVLDKDKQANLRQIAEQLGSSKLSFASQERLQKYLGLEKGSVTPLGVINDHAHEVTVVLDADLAGRSKLGVHPNENTTSVFLSYEDLLRYLEDCGNPVIIAQI